MPHISLTDLRLFSAIADEKNLTRAAARSFLAPSSASVRIKNLEEQLRVPLLARKSRGIELTPAGEIVSQYAKRMLWQIDDLQRALQPYVRLQEGLVNVWANYGASIDFLPADIAQFLTLNQGVKIRLEQHASPDVVAAVASGKADIGVCAYEDNDHNVDFHDYRTDRLVLITPRAHALAGLPSCWLKQSLPYDFVCLTDESAMQRFIFEKARVLGAPIEPRVQVDNQQILIELVGSGAGIGITSQRAVSEVSRDLIHVVELLDPWAVRRLRIATSHDSSRLRGWPEQLMHFLADRARQGTTAEQNGHYSA